MKEPKLRTVEKYQPPYPLNCFPPDFAVRLGREVIYHLATRQGASLEGEDWERIFASCVGADWIPSNVGLDDVILEQTAWGAKSVKVSTPSKATRIRLVSGRNSTVFSFGDRVVSQCDPTEMGEKILAIWNERVAGIRRKYKHLRTVVLLKSSDLLELSVFEFDTEMFTSADFEWIWNKNNNLEGHHRISGDHRFTWQPSGSQFTIIESVPSNRLTIRIKQPPKLDQDEVLKALNFDSSWIEIVASI
jgi:hypothetical protein